MVSSWLVPAVCASLLWAIVNLADKVLLTTRLKSITGRVYFDAIIGLTTCIPLIPFLTGFNGSCIILSMIAGMFLLGFNLLYYQAIKASDPAVTAGYLQIVPALTAVFGYFFFSEVFGGHVYFGIVAVTVGVILVSFENPVKNRGFNFSGKNSKTLLSYILPGALVISISYAFQKKLVATYTPIEVFFWGRIGCFFLLGFVYICSKSIRFKVVRSFEGTSYPSLGWAGAVEWLNFGGILLLIFAYANGPITLVTVTTASQPLFVIAGSIMLSLLGVKAIKDQVATGYSIVIFRIVAILVIAVGLYFLVNG